MAKHASPPKPSRKANLRGWILVLAFEFIALFGLFYALTLFSSTYLIGQNGLVWMTLIAFGLVIIGIPILAFFDWPATKKGKDAYDATHDGSRLVSALKLGLDTIGFIRSKGSSNSDKIITGIQALMPDKKQADTQDVNISQKGSSNEQNQNSSQSMVG